MNPKWIIRDDKSNEPYPWKLWFFVVTVGLSIFVFLYLNGAVK